MKKNTMMRIASFLLIAVLITTSTISGTYAKYVTKVGNQDEARVARWGFTGIDAEIAITDLFHETYKQGAGDSNVLGENAEDIIAPGTTNKATFQFVYSATGDNAGTPDSVAAPEVDYKITVSTEGSICDDAIKNNPNIKWAVCKSSELDTDGIVTAGDWGTWNAMITKIQSLAGTTANPATAGVATHEAGTLPDIAEEYTIAWQWIFETASAADSDGDGSNDQDEADTLMGNAGELDDVVIHITITAEQID